MAQLTCIVVTPETTALEEMADFVALQLYDGELGISPGHSPMIGRLGYGELRLKVGSSERRFYVDSGFVQVADNVVSVLTNRAVSVADLDAEAAQRQLDDAHQKPSNTPELMQIRERLMTQARAQLRMART
jgi:F-type H+-transporting ATPase subunit epsilon